MHFRGIQLGEQTKTFGGKSLPGSPGPPVFSRLALSHGFSACVVNQGTWVPAARAMEDDSPQARLRGCQKGYVGGKLWSYLSFLFLLSLQEIRNPAGWRAEAPEQA